MYLYASNILVFSWKKIGDVYDAKNLSWKTSFFGTVLSAKTVR